MKYLFFLSLIVVGCTFKSNVKDKHNAFHLQKEKIELQFNILKERVGSFRFWEEGYEDFDATLMRTNKSDSVLTVPKMLTYGHKGEGNYIESFDLNGKEIDINNEAHYQWLYWLDDEFFMEIGINESKLDTLSMTSFYNYKEKGKFKLRFVYEFQGDTIYSNWDTLEVY